MRLPGRTLCFTPRRFTTRCPIPLIPDLVGGAESFGLTALTAAHFPSVIANAPVGASAAMVLQHSGAGVYAIDYPGYDILFLINVSQDRLVEP